MFVNLYMYVYIYTQYYSEYHTPSGGERGPKEYSSVSLFVYGHITDGFLVRTHNPQCAGDDGQNKGVSSRHTPSGFQYTHTCVSTATDAMPSVRVDWKALYLTIHTHLQVTSS